MLEKITFKNHMGEVIDFGEGGLYLNNNKLRSYRWKYDSKNNRISYFFRDVQEKKLPIVVVPDTRATGNDIMNRLMELADKDVIAKEPGRIIIGDYYLDCFLFSNDKYSYELKDGVFYADLVVVTDKPAWIKETTQIFNNWSGSEDQMLDFPYDYPYDFTSPSKIRTLVNTGFIDSEFKLIVYGEVTDPVIYIGGHEYSFTGHIGAREYVEIDSREKTVYLVQNDGTKVNWFSHRNKDSYIFQKMPAGEVAVSWTGTYRFDVVLYEERSEPKWT